MQYTFADHAVLIALVVFLPLYGIWEFRLLKSWVAARRANARLWAYGMTMTILWVLALAVLGVWTASGRDFSLLGFGFDPGIGFWIGAGLALVGSGLLILQTVSLVKSPEKLRDAGKSMESMRVMLPHNSRETRAFSALSITAGICEEILYRGFLIAYLGEFLGTWPAIVLSSIAFGLIHTYQGFGGIMKTAAIGLIMAGFYLLTGSLWIPMLLHTVIDLNSGYMGRKAIALADEPAGPATART